MRHRLQAIITPLVLVGVCVGQPGDAEPARKPQPFAGKVVQVADPEGKADPKSGAGKLVLKTDAGKTYPLVKDAASMMLFLDRRLRDRPVRLLAQPEPKSKSLRVVRVQTLKTGAVYDVDYWCEICQISLDHPGQCYCCGDEVVFRERPAR